MDNEEIEFKDENVFGMLGLTDDGTSYVSIAGIYDYFWALKPEARLRLVQGWIQGLETFINPLFIDEQAPEDFSGALFVFKSDFVVEEKENIPEIVVEEERPKGVVVPFRPKK